MSHFVVVVVGEDIDEQLAAYAEQEFDPKYGEFRDLSQEFKDRFEDETVEIVRNPDGTWKFPAGNEQENAQPVERVPVKSLFSSFEQYVKDWHGYDSPDKITGTYGYWYNPKAKWDWYQIGGRWTGYFKLKPNATGAVGHRGVFGTAPKTGYADVIKVKDLDLEGMQQDSKKTALQFVEQIRTVLAGRTMPSWRDILERHNKDANSARKEYLANAVVKDLLKERIFLDDEDEALLLKGPQAYVEAQVKSALVPFAFVKDGIWHEKGSMGWFGISTDNQDPQAWNESFLEMLKSLPPDTVITAVDCHI